MTPPSHRQCAATIIRNAAGEVLLVQQNYGTHAWGTPGGVVEPGETPMEAAIRETSEEVGLNVTLSYAFRLIFLYTGACRQRSR